MNDRVVVVAYFVEPSDLAIRNRSVESYLVGFRNWAAICNELIVFVPPRMVEDVLKIRREFGLEKETTVVPIYDSMEELLPEFTEKIKNNIKNSDLKNNVFDVLMTFKSWEYVIAVNLKPYFIKKASQMLEYKANILYMDFGMIELSNLQWDCKMINKYVDCSLYSNSKITLYQYNHFTIDEPLYIVLKYALGCLYTPVMIIPSNKVDWLYDAFYSALEAVLRVGLTAQDQNIFYLLRKENPEKFDVQVLREPHSMFEDLLGRKIERKPIVSRNWMVALLRDNDAIKDLYHKIVYKKNMKRYFKRERKTLKRLYGKR